MKKLLIIILTLKTFFEPVVLQARSKKSLEKINQMVKSMQEVSASFFNDFLDDEDDFDATNSRANLQIGNSSFYAPMQKFSQHSSFSLNNFNSFNVSETGSFKINFPNIQNSLQPEGDITKHCETNKPAINNNGNQEIKLYELCESAKNYTKTISISAQVNTAAPQQMFIKTVVSLDPATDKFGMKFGGCNHCTQQILSIPDGFTAKVASVKILDDGIEVTLAKVTATDPLAEEHCNDNQTELCVEKTADASNEQASSTLE